MNDKTGARFDSEAIIATKVHPNRKYFKEKNILIYLSSCIVIVSSIMMVVACIWYSSMDVNYYNAENIHEHEVCLLFTIYYYF